MEQIREMLARVPNLSDVEQQEYYTKLVDMIERGLCPEEVFDYVGNGSYKECYSLNDKYVIKFCSAANPTEAERYILEEAARNGLIDLFVPCYFCHLECAIPLSYLGENYDYSYRYNEEEHCEYRYYHNDDEITTANYIIIQPRAIPSSTDYKPSKRKSLPVHVEFESPIFDASWNECVNACYGEAYLNKFTKFCQTYGLWDLRSDNIGYLNNKPVILDWMSEKKGN